MLLSASEASFGSMLYGKILLVDLDLLKLLSLYLTNIKLHILHPREIDSELSYTFVPDGRAASGMQIHHDVLSSYAVPH